MTGRNLPYVTLSLLVMIMWNPGCKVLGIGGKSNDPHMPASNEPAASSPSSAAAQEGSDRDQHPVRQPNAQPKAEQGGVEKAAGESLVDCSRPEYQSTERPGALVNRASRPTRIAKEWSQPGSFPTAECEKAVRLCAQAYCQKPNVGYYKRSLKEALNICRAWDARKLAYERAKSQGKPAVLASMSADQARRTVQSWLFYAKIASDPRHTNYERALSYYRKVLDYFPNHPVAAPKHDEVFARYYGISEARARKLRLDRLPQGRLSKWTKPKLYQLAIDELLGKHHQIENGQPKLAFDYMDVLYLVNKVYLPAIEANPDKFRSTKCSMLLAEKRRDFRQAEVKKAMNEPLCSQGQTTIAPREVMRDHRLRMALIEILAQSTTDPKAAVANAAAVVARQVGAEKKKVCWCRTNPFRLQNGIEGKCPWNWAHHAGRRTTRRYRSLRAAAGSRETTSATLLFRQPYYSVVYSPKGVTLLTGMEADMALMIARKAGDAGSGLIAALEKQVKRARRHKCVAFEVTLQRVRIGRGSWGPLQLWGVGSSKDVPCKAVRRSSEITRTVKDRWTNYFDTVIGGKFVGSWAERRSIVHRRYSRRWELEVRKLRSAIIYVRRKI